MRQFFCVHRNNSGDIARSRLKLLLVSDQAHVNPGLIDLMKEDMIGVLSRYAEVDSGALDLRMIQMEDAATRESIPALSATFPIRTFVSGMGAIR